MAKLRKDRWHTYRECCFTGLYGNNAAAAGGIELRQVRRARKGRWLERRCCVNGNHLSTSEPWGIDSSDGEYYWSRVEKEEEDRERAEWILAEASSSKNELRKLT